MSFDIFLSTPANGANGMSDMTGNAARVAVERSGSCRDTRWLLSIFYFLILPSSFLL